MSGPYRKRGERFGLADQPQGLAVRQALPGGPVAVTVILAAVVVVACSIVAWDGNVPEWEADMLRFINDWPDWLEPVMWFFQQAGVFLAPVVAGVIIVWFTREWRHLIPFVAVLPLKLGIEKAIVKQLIDRERPFVSIGPDIKVRGPAFDGLSFPSGHSTTAFAMGILIAAFVPPRWRPVPIAWAFVVAIARLYYGEHNILDVVAGAAIGTTFAVTLWYFFLNRFAPDHLASS